MITAIAAVALASTATFLSCFLAFLSYGHHRRQALDYWKRERKLPLATRYAHLETMVEQLQGEYDALRDQMFDARELLDEAQRKREWMESAREEIAELERERQEVARLQNELESRQIELAQLQETLTKLNADADERREAIEKTQAEHAKLVREIEDLKAEASRADLIRSELAELEGSRNAIKQQIEDLQRNANELRSKLESELRGLKRECQEAEHQRESSRKKLDELDKEIDSLANRRNQLNDERRNLERQVEELEGQKASLSGQLPALQAAFDRVSSAVQQSIDSPDPQESELWQPVFQKVNEATAASGTELEYLESLEDNLRENGLRFDQRTVFAFHTSLKSTASSPLVTLAGVSGTGKSELPRRYADALGINFLNVAVQPRWDSPQDLFGFYDYLERRFRPTELTRALVHMDPVGPVDGRGWEPAEAFTVNRCANQMLLVLLDEMNLARVEYYFSEFLSKLETRRGINLDDTAQRQRAEIVLEVSGRQRGKPPLRLLVDSNVLFVGTMNEDESTLALSDKVVDRSNVLRFGSPNTLAPSVASHRDVDARQPPKRLSRKTWQSWCRAAHDLDPVDERKLLAWIDELRKAMDRIGRPFAYRVAHAMLEYAANYPQSDSRVQFAIVDQIEQRILPKLIGLDLQQSGAKQTLQTISRILTEVEDEKLSERIEAAGNDDYFQWKGLDRTEV